MNLRWFAYVLIAIGIAIAIWYLTFGNYFNGQLTQPSISKAKEIQSFITGLVVPLITLASALLVIENLRTANMQNFTNNFFKLIDQNRKILECVNVDSTHLGKGDIKGQGKEFFDDLALEMAKNYTIIIENDPKKLKQLDPELVKSTKGKIEKELIVALYDHYFHIHQSDISHYFRNLYYIVDYLDKARFKLALKHNYAGILRSQLSNYELLILAYNGIHEYGEKFYPLIEKYQLIRSLNDETRLAGNRKKRIIDLKLLKSLYPKSLAYFQ